VSSSTFGLIELLFVFGVVLAWACWQLWTVRRELKRPPKDESEP